MNEFSEYIVITEARGSRRLYKIVEVDSHVLSPPGPVVLAESYHRTSADRIVDALNAWDGR